MKKRAPGLKVDRKFKAMIPALSGEEYRQLEANIRKDGCRDALVLWDGILLDGHNRLKICRKHDIRFRTKTICLPSREAAAEWIDTNQLGRRNLTPDQARVIRGRLYNRKKKGHGGDRKSSGQSVHLKTAESVAKAWGVDERTVRRDGKFAEAVAKEPELNKAIMAGESAIQVKRELKERGREVRREKNRRLVRAAKNKVKPNHQFSTIVIDPPWDWGDEGDVDQLGRARPTYETLSLEKLRELRVRKFADKDCHIYLWITNRSLPKGFDLLEAWGFRYVTCLTWIKPSIGMGNYFRGSTEHVLFGIKGSQPLKRKDVGTWFKANRGKGGHSSKPKEFYALVESCSPGPYLDMFARGKRKGWAVWGAEA